MNIVETQSYKKAIESGNVIPALVDFLADLTYDDCGSCTKEVSFVAKMFLEYFDAETLKELHNETN